MRTLAEILFWTGRLEVVASVMIALHCLIIWRFHHWTRTRWAAIAWLAVFFALSLLLFPMLLEPTTRGIDYVEAHLFGGIWSSEQEALSNMALRWQNILLPSYSTWVAIWLVGVAAVAVLARVERKAQSSELGLEA